jgi:threonine aldolase
MDGMETEDLAQQFASDNYAGICPEAWDAMQAANVGHATAYGARRGCLSSALRDQVRAIFRLQWHRR